jgi:hypothetical protein
MLSLEELQALQRQAAEVYVDPALISWTVDVATATRQPREHGLNEIADYVSFGASPRGPISLVAAGRALALIRGRDYVIPADLEALATGPDVFPRLLAQGFALADMPERAMHWLEIAVARGFINYPFLAQYDPALEGLRANPKFVRLMDTVRGRWEQFLT